MAMDPKSSRQAGEPEHPDRMQIGELARATGLNQRTIHFWEQSGLMRPSTRVGGGYRYYDRSAIERVRMILRLKDIGLSIEEIREVIDLYFIDPKGIAGKRQVVQILERHLATTDEQIHKLQRFRDDLIRNISKLSTMVECIEMYGPK